LARTDRTSLVFLIMISLTPILSIHFPRFLAFWPLIIGLTFTLYSMILRKEKFNIPTLYYKIVGVISALCLISTLWSIAPAEAFEDAIKASAILLLGGLFVGTCKNIDAKNFTPYWWLFPAATICAALLCAFDLATDLALYKILHTKTELDRVNTSVMNRGLVCLIFAYFISFFFLTHAKSKYKTVMTVALTGAVILALSQSQSQSAQLALIAGIMFFFLFPAQYRKIYWAFGISIIVAMLLTPVITSYLFSFLAGNAQSEWLNIEPDTHAEAAPWLYNAYIGNRAEIWDFVTKYALNNPLYGFGIEATKYVPLFEHAHIFHTEDTILHPHNFSVQIWIEFGLVGVAAFSAVIIALLKEMALLPQNTSKRISTTLLFITLLFASMTYGLWQSWWLGELIFIASLCVLFVTMPVSPKAGQKS